MRASLALLVVMPLMPLMAPCLALNLVEMKPLAAAMLAICAVLLYLTAAIIAYAIVRKRRG